MIEALTKVLEGTEVASTSMAAWALGGWAIGGRLSFAPLARFGLPVDPRPERGR